MIIIQEEIEQRSVTLAISTTKLTGRVLKAAITKYLNYLKEASRSKSSPGVYPKGKQSVKQLVGQGQSVDNIEISYRNIKDFDRVARKYGVDYAVKKDRAETPPKYLVFFKAKDIDVLKAAFKEYTADTVRKKGRSSILQKIRDFMPLVKQQEKEKNKELER